MKEYKPQTIDGPLLEDLSQLVRMSIREDLDRFIDITTAAMVPHGATGSAAIISRVGGVAAGFELLPSILDEFDCTVEADVQVGDSQAFEARATLAVLKGNTRDLLTVERTLLNILGRLCGIATWTQRFVKRIEHTRARVYDTRKTTPGWRRLEKYAVRCGGGHTHRMGLYDAILIKDNHLAANQNSFGTPMDPYAAVLQARHYLQSSGMANSSQVIIEIEIDRVEQLENAIRAEPDIILLDNMSRSDMRYCASFRDARNPAIQLEASGGVNLDTISGIADTRVDRISVGALTHSAVNLDLGLDWLK
jgi:nicotinate-nucleotide pyrophosphorylase (carboxylating)